MFTGIVEHLGSVLTVNPTKEGRRLAVDLGPLDGLAVGDSLAVNGVCLTAITVDGNRLEVEAVLETLSRTTLGELEEGDPVNLERAMAAAGRFDGHIVQGHVDGVGEVVAVVPEGAGMRMTVHLPEGLMRYVVEKGSLTVDGVSLTLARVMEESVEIALIPHTLEVTTLGLRIAGDPVNLEVDVLAKYVERLVKARS